MSQQEVGVRLKGRVQQPERNIEQVIENIVRNKLPRITENSLILPTYVQWLSVVIRDTVNTIARKRSV